MTEKRGGIIFRVTQDIIFLKDNYIESDSQCSVSLFIVEVVDRLLAEVVHPLRDISSEFEFELWILR